jgi:hypothetical protein
VKIGKMIQRLKGEKHEQHDDKPLSPLKANYLFLWQRILCFAFAEIC